MKKKGFSKKNIFRLVIGCAFIAYGSFKLITYFSNDSEETSLLTYRIVIAVGFIVLGAYDLYKFYSSLHPE